MPFLSRNAVHASILDLKLKENNLKHNKLMYGQLTVFQVLHVKSVHKSYNTENCKIVNNNTYV